MALEDYEDALKSFIHDDDKLVTYKWLSKEFEIHVNIAKDILKQYWEKYKDEENIVATFLLVGQLKDGSIRVEVVRESNLNVAKDKFANIDCEHLYSLQKFLHDVELLACAGEGDLRYSAIKCNEEYVRNDEEIEGLRYIGNVRKEESKSNCSNKLPNKIVDKQSPKKIESFKEKSQNLRVENDNSKEKDKVKDTGKIEPKLESKTVNIEKKVSPTNKSTNSKPNNKVTKKPVQSKQSGFNSLFGKVSIKPQASVKSKEESDDIEQRKNSINDKKKDDTKESKEKEDEKKDQEKGNDENSQEKENRNSQSKEKSKNVLKIDNKIDNKIDTKSKSKNKSDTRGKKRNRSQETNSSSKRKRIVVIDSSEDESDKSNADDNEEEEPMEVEEELPKISRKRSSSPPAEKRENGKRMIRKTIEKTFKDEDGYLVTKRVHVYEVASDNDEPEEVKKEELKKPKPVENKAKKQTSLMSFFKKS